jgi:predicted N-acetyltransferase YhbS
LPADTGDLSIEAFSTAQDRRRFESGAEELDRYLKEQVSQDVRRRVAAAFVAQDAGQVVGYYTLSATAIELNDLPEDVARRLPHYPQVPATLLGRLAVDASWRGRGLGERLLIDALARSLASQIASYAVVVDARDEAAASFYRRYGFQHLSQSGRRLFIPMATIARLPFG